MAQPRGLRASTVQSCWFFSRWLEQPQLQKSLEAELLPREQQQQQRHEPLEDGEVDPEQALPAATAVDLRQQLLDDAMGDLKDLDSDAVSLRLPREQRWIGALLSSGPCSYKGYSLLFCIAIVVPVVLAGSFQLACARVWPPTLSLSFWPKRICNSCGSSRGGGGSS